MGEINAGTLVMQEGAFFEGNLRMGDKAGQAAPAASKATAKF
jgi:cytoskeletal protein CcmA (bactofilin family)